MPIYEFECDKCETKREIMLPMSKAGQKQTCTCGQVLRRKFSSTPFYFVETGRDRVLATLNQEEGGSTFPGGDKHRARYEQAMAKGLDPPKPTIGRGF